MVIGSGLLVVLALVSALVFALVLAHALLARPVDRALAVVTWDEVR